MPVWYHRGQPGPLWSVATNHRGRPDELNPHLDRLAESILEQEPRDVPGLSRTVEWTKL